MYTASYKKVRFIFRTPGGTSRGVLYDKDSYFIVLSDKNHRDKFGVGEASLLPGLSIDAHSGFEEKIQDVCSNIDNYINNYQTLLKAYPSIQFALETALLDMKHDASCLLFPSDFTEGKQGISINGLIWMGEISFMQKQIREKIAEGFSCLKLKIGALDFDDELRLLQQIRAKYSKESIELRVDANGAFSLKDAHRKLEALSKLDIHSIEQPIKAGQWDAMRKLCENTPLPIALDEELIGVSDKQELLQYIHPQYIILKPSLLGGLAQSREWIDLAEARNIDWWLTSALESNIGLNAIAQWTYTQNNPLPQGLGTGKVFTNNFDSPLAIESGHLVYRNTNRWELDSLCP